MNMLRKTVLGKKRPLLYRNNKSLHIYYHQNNLSKRYSTEKVVESIDPPSSHLKIGEEESKLIDLIKKEWEAKMHPYLNVPPITPSTFSPAEYALQHRLGLENVPPLAFRSALCHPLLPSSNPLFMTSNSDLQEALFLNSQHTMFQSIGRRLIGLFSNDYIMARFPKLPSDAHRLACAIYEADRNLAVMGRSIGMEYAVVESIGLPCIKYPRLEIYLKEAINGALKKFESKALMEMNKNENIITKSTEEENSSKEREEKRNKIASLQLPTSNEIYSALFKAIIGVTFQNLGAMKTRTFLDNHLFSGTFPIEILCRPKAPMLKLAQVLTEKLSRSPPDYRLLHETGRLSNEAVFVVGVYSGREKIAEAFGPSLFVAKERAAIEALRKIFLIETPKAPRKSDHLLNNEQNAQLKDIDQLEVLFK